MSDSKNIESFIEKKLQKGLDRVFKTIDESIQKRIEQKFDSSSQKENDNNHECDCEKAPQRNRGIKSKQYQIDGSMILQNSNADINLKGMTSEKFESNGKLQPNSSHLNSRIFSITPEDQDQSFYSQDISAEYIPEQENIKPNQSHTARMPAEMRQSRSSGAILHPHTQKLQRAIKDCEVPESEEMATKTIMSMYSSNKISKQDILENIIAVEQEMDDPENLKNIAFRLQKKLEEKAHKLRELQHQQDLEYEMESQYYTSEGEGESMQEVENSKYSNKYFNPSISDIYTSQASYQQ